MFKSILTFCIVAFAWVNLQAQIYKFGDYMQFGREELSQGNYKEAIGHLNNAIKHRPASFEGWYFRGIAKYFLDDLLGAEQDLTESIKFDPYNSELFHLRAIVRSRRYNFGGAMNDYNSAIELNPKNPIFYVNRSRVFLFLENYDSCINDCNRAIQLRYEEHDVYLLRGTALSGLKKYDDALADIDKATRLNPGITNSYIQRGSIWTELHQPDSAIADYNRALNIDPADAGALLSRALVFMEQTDTTAALSDLNLVLEVSPFNSYAYYNRAIILLGKNATGEALEDLDRVITLNPDNIVIYLFRGKVKHATGELKEAIEDFTRAIEIYPEFADAYYERSKVKEQMHDFQGARKDMQMAYMVNDFYFSSDEGEKLEQQMYLKRMLAFRDDLSLYKIAGAEGQPDKIDLLPAFQQVLFSSDLSAIRFHDTKLKPEYSDPIISLSNRSSGINTDLSQSELVKMNDMPENRADLEQYYMKSAILHANLLDFGRAFELFGKAVQANPQNVMAWFGKANARLNLILISKLQSEPQYQLTINGGQFYGGTPMSSVSGSHSYDYVLRDMNRVLELDPEFSFGWYNRGLVKSYKGDYWGAVSDLTAATRINSDFAEAWFNKGLLLIFLDLKSVGCNDLSQAGELGVDLAYPVMLRYCIK